MNLGTLRDVLLVRIACAGATGITRATLRADLEPLVEHRLNAVDWRRSLDELLVILLTEELVAPHRMRLAATTAGLVAAQRFLGAPLPVRPDWTEVRDVLLVGRALGWEGLPAPRRKRLDSAQGLRGAILEHSFGLPASKTTTVPSLRDTLARKAVTKAAANGQAHSHGTVPKSMRSRRAVERLLRRPREFASDAALLAELAAEQVGALETSVPSLRKALLRRLIGRGSKGAPPGRRSKSGRTATSAPETNTGIATAVTGVDTQTFVAEVTRLARACAEGWDGNRRAYIARVWEQLSAAQPHWGLTAPSFKAALVEAHKSGRLTLAYADLRSKETIDLVQASAVRDRNNEWHFIRVEG